MLFFAIVVVVMQKKTNSTNIPLRGTKSILKLLNFPRVSSARKWMVENRISLAMHNNSLNSIGKHAKKRHFLWHLQPKQTTTSVKCPEWKHVLPVPNPKRMNGYIAILLAKITLIFLSFVCILPLVLSFGQCIRVVCSIFAFFSEIFVISKQSIIPATFWPKIFDNAERLTPTTNGNSKVAYIRIP